MSHNDCSLVDAPHGLCGVRLLRKGDALHGLFLQPGLARLGLRVRGLLHGFVLPYQVLFRGVLPRRVLVDRRQPRDGSQALLLQEQRFFVQRSLWPAPPPPGHLDGPVLRALVLGTGGAPSPTPLLPLVVVVVVVVVVVGSREGV